MADAAEQYRTFCVALYSSMLLVVDNLVDDSAYTACLLASFSRQRMPAKQANLALKAT